ncbi:tail fiber assembly protein [Enterobacteriaceae bacterium ML5]|nr:tail fiber assembly protein [Enterobacteriaceae bacterium ML5]
MNDFYYSAKNNGFYAYALKNSYEQSKNGWPVDAIALSDNEYSALLEGQRKGKVITAGSSGKPVLSDPPAPTPDQLLEDAKAKRDSLMALATVAISPLQDAVDIDEATDAEIAMLKAWKKYRVALSRLDLSAAPDIEWPEEPK